MSRVAAAPASSQGGSHLQGGARRPGAALAQRGALGFGLHAAPHLSHLLLLASPSPHQAQRVHHAVAITGST